MSTVDVRLPSPKDVCDLLGNLLGRDVTCAHGAPVEVTLDKPAVVAVYVDDALRMYGVVVFDIPLAASCGAALSLVPARIADLAAESGALTDALAENVGEVLNIMTSLVAGAHARHLRLHQVYQADERLPADVAALVARFGARLDLNLDITGYTRGAMSISLA